jgi:endonuclease YncB( thermonuclease family)
MKSNLLILILLIVFPISTHALDIRKTVDRSIREIGEVYTCVLDDVDDGDTVDLLCGEKLIPSVRLLGVNAPDIIMPENQKHCYYSEARSVMRKIQQNKRKISAQFYGSDLCADTAK